MAIFVISNLQGRNFTFENIKFENLSANTSTEKRWRDVFHATFIATADDNLNVTPIIQNAGLVGAVHDICLLLSLAQSRSVNCPYYVCKGLDTQRFHSARGILFGEKLVLDDKIESYLSTASQALRRQGWIGKTGFTPSVYYFVERYHHVPGEVGFMLTWIALEILANTFVRRRKISNILPRNKFRVVKEALAKTLSQMVDEVLAENQKELVMKKVPELNRLSIYDKIVKLRDTYGWDFIPDKLIVNCNKVRNQMLHSGSYRNFNRAIISKLYDRLATSVQLMLIDLLACSNYVHNLDELKTQIKGNEE